MNRMLKKVTMSLISGVLMFTMVLPIFAQSELDKMPVEENDEVLVEDNVNEEDVEVNEEDVEVNGIINDNTKEEVDTEEEKTLEVTKDIKESFLGDPLTEFDEADWSIDFSDPSIAFLNSYNGGFKENIYVPGEYDFGINGVRQIKIKDLAMFKDKAKRLHIEEVNNKKALLHTNQLVYSFRDDNNLEYADLNGLDVSHIENFTYVFYKASALEQLHIEKWDVSAGTSFERMFYMASALKSLDLNEWDVSNARSFGFMFEATYSLETLNISDWDTSNAKIMRSMFKEAERIEVLDIGRWDVSNVEHFAYTFGGMKALHTLEISNWDVSSAELFSGMFSETENLKYVDFSNWRTPNLMYIESMFYEAKGFESIDLNSFDVSRVEDPGYLFMRTENVKELRIDQWDTSSMTWFYGLFEGMRSLKTLDLSNWDVSKVTDFRFIFENTDSLQYINLENWNVRPTANTANMFVTRQPSSTNLKEMNRVVISEDPTIVNYDFEADKNYPLTVATLNANTIKDPNDANNQLGEFTDGDLTKAVELPNVVMASDVAIDSFVTETMGNNEPQEAGYTFLKWSPEVNDVIQEYLQTGTITYDAKWYNSILSYDANTTDTTLTGTTPEDVKLLAGTTVTVAGNTGNLYRDGYKFIGWSTKSNPTSLDIIYGDQVGQQETITPTASTVLYAVWKEEISEVEIIWHPNNGEETFSTTVLLNEQIILPTTPTLKGSVFEGWYTDAALTENIPNTITEVPQAGTVNYYAKYKAIDNIEVSFDTQLPLVESPQSMIVTYGQTYGSLPKITAKGYEFVGWYFDRTFEDQVLDTTVVTLEDDHTLYAKWKKIEDDKEEEIIEPVIPKEEKENPKPSEKIPPKTGINENIYLPLFVIVIAGIIVVVLSKNKKIRNK